MVGKKYMMDNKPDPLSKSNQQNDIYNYNLDHVYCSDNSNYHRNNTINSTASDLKTLRKENKQLQAMLLLHLDLIQEQSNQLIAKDKQLIQLREENEQLRLKCERADRRTASKGGKTQNSNSPTIDSYFASVDCNQKNLFDDKFKSHSPLNTKYAHNIIVNENNTNELVPSTEKSQKDEIKPICNLKERLNNSERLTIDNNVIGIKYRTIENNVIGSSNGKIISKIILQRTQSDTGEKIFVKAKNVEVENKASDTEIGNNIAAMTIKTEVIDIDSDTATVSEVADKSATNENSSDDVTICESSEQPIKIENLKENRNAEETNKHDKTIEMKTRSSEQPHNTVKLSAFDAMRATSNSNMPTVPTPTDSGRNNGATIIHPLSRRHSTRNSYITTTKAYTTREWQLDEIEFEVNQQITDEPCKENVNDATQQTNLEIPKWKTWEFCSGRDLSSHREHEDLSEDAFRRRHARFLLDERKRKKWDVQRIREQRTIERLKRRHCKEELIQPKECNEITSFFPSAENLKWIHITDDLPVSGFGELIPALPTVEFQLPWMRIGNGASGSSNTEPSAVTTSQTTSNIPQIKISNDNIVNLSSIIFLPKKRAGRTKTNSTTSNWKNIV